MSKDVASVYLTKNDFPPQIFFYLYTRKRPAKSEKNKAINKALQHSMLKLECSNLDTTKFIQLVQTVVKKVHCTGSSNMDFVDCHLTQLLFSSALFLQSSDKEFYNVSGIHFK
jgi:hypothetical protein